MLETLEQNGFQEIKYDYSDIMKDRLVLFETIKNLIDKTTDNDPCIFTNAEVKVSEKADNIYVSGSKSKIDLHKKERRQGNTKTIQAFVDLSNSPIKSTREEISFCNAYSNTRYNNPWKNEIEKINSIRSEYKSI